MTPATYRDDNGTPEFPTKLRWLQYLLEHYGVPTVILMVALWWFASRVAEPLVQCHVQFMQNQVKAAAELVNTQQQIVATQQQLAKQNEKTSAVVDNIHQLTQRHETMTASQTQAIESIRRKVDAN